MEMETKESPELSFRSNHKKKMVKGVFHHNWRNWAGLPRNLLFEIMDRVAAVDDYVKFGAVSRSWRSIFLEENISNLKKHCSQPFLLIRSPDDDDDKMVLCSLNNDGKMYSFDLQLAADTTYCRGSTFGWLITSSDSKDNGNNLHVHLRNPFLSAIINLPDIAKARLDPERYELDNPDYLWKAVLSCDPHVSEEFQVAAIVSPVMGLAVLDSRRTDWVCIGDDWERDVELRAFVDVIFFTKTKQFYVLRLTQYQGYNNGEVLAIHDIDGGFSKLVPVVPPLPDEYCYRDGRHIRQSNLVEDMSSGDLLLVHRWEWEYNESDTDFEVFKLDPTNKTWIPNDLSGKVLFLGISTSVIRLASDCPGCKPNSVYFTAEEGQIPCQRGYRVYDLETRSLHQHYYSPPTPPKHYFLLTPKGSTNLEYPIPSMWIPHPDYYWIPTPKPTPPIWIEPTLQR